MHPLLLASKLACGSSLRTVSQSRRRLDARSDCKVVRAGPATSASKAAAVTCVLPLMLTVQSWGRGRERGGES